MAQKSICLKFVQNCKKKKLQAEFSVFFPGDKTFETISEASPETTLKTSQQTTLKTSQETTLKTTKDDVVTKSNSIEEIL